MAADVSSADATAVPNSAVPNSAAPNSAAANTGDDARSCRLEGEGAFDSTCKQIVARALGPYFGPPCHKGGAYRQPRRCSCTKYCWGE